MTLISWRSLTGTLEAALRTGHRRALLGRELKNFLSGGDAFGLTLVVSFPLPPGDPVRGFHYSSVLTEHGPRPGCTRLARFFKAATIIFFDD